MDKGIQDKCGIAVTSSLHTTHNYLKDLKHRGKEAAGIAAIGEEGIDIFKWAGPPEAVDLEDLVNILERGKYYGYLGHTRYKTSGTTDQMLEDAHPIALGGNTTHKGNHIIIKNAEQAIVHNGEVDLGASTDSDTRALLQYYDKHSLDDLLQDIPLAYTAAIADVNNNYIAAARDRTGIRPGVLGKKDGSFTIASEDIAVKKNGGKVIQNMTPGAVYRLRPRGNFEKEQVVQPQLQRCFFEYNYIADEDSILDGHSVKEIRQQYGDILAKRIAKENVDYVTHVPRTPEPAARAYADATNAEFIHAFYKLNDERSFMGTTQEEREKILQQKLHVNPKVESKLSNSNLVVIDDSIVRGTMIERVAQLLDETGVDEKTFISYTPPIGQVIDGEPRGCHWGVNMHPSETEFFARENDISKEQVIKDMHVIYATIPETELALHEEGLTPDNHCTYCIGGEHPNPDL